MMISHNPCIYLVLTVILSAPNVSSTRRQKTDSILDLINVKEVERLLAKQKQQEMNELNPNRHNIIENEFGYNELPGDDGFDMQQFNLLDGPTQRENSRIDSNVFLRKQNSSDFNLLSDLRGLNGRKLLKSSKKALYITKKEYLQKDWCKTEPLIQKVREQGCITRTLINRFCYGQCNSFYIPKNPKRRYKHVPPSEEREDEDQYGPSFRSCGFCKPSKYTWVTVTLKCPNLVPQLRRKRIQRIKQCSCMAAKVD